LDSGGCARPRRHRRRCGSREVLAVPVGRRHGARRRRQRSRAARHWTDGHPTRHPRDPGAGRRSHACRG
jgi:hypothetical protein